MEEWRKKPLTCQSRKVFIVIRKNKVIPIAKIKEYCQKKFEKYAFIEHAHDLNERGEVEGCHYHIVGDMVGAKIPFSQRLNELSQFFGFDNNNGVQIDQYTSLEGAIQYLTHKRYQNKTQHDVKEIFTNIPKEEFDIYYNAELGDVLRADDIYRLCKKHDSIVGIILEIGVGMYKTNRSVILDVFKCINGHSDYNRMENIK